MEILIDSVFSNGDFDLHYKVEKENSGDRVHLILKKVDEKGEKYIDEISHFSIPEYEHPMLSWYNLFFCSNNYGITTDHIYMNQAVQKGKKTAATIYYGYNSPEGQELISKMPGKCAAMPYMGDNMIYMYQKGKLADFFDYEKIKDYYLRYGCKSVQWDIVKDYFQKDMAFFGDENKCGFSLQNGGNTEQCIIKGLILGYPVASTAEWI